MPYAQTPRRADFARMRRGLRNFNFLPVPYGAPLRLRLGNQLGYKMAKYLRRIDLVESLSHIEGGHGGLYEDNGYAWHAGI